MVSGDVGGAQDERGSICRRVFGIPVCRLKKEGLLGWQTPPHGNHL